VTRSVEDLLRTRTAAGGHRLTDEAYAEAWKKRIRAKVVVDANGCWLWQGFVHKNGYASTTHRDYGGSRAHRLVYLVWKGPIRADHDACHSCDVRHCVNPDHLWAGTRKQNLHDMLAKGRHMHQVVTHCKRGHAYAEHGYSYAYNGTRWRRCRLCDRINSKKPSFIAWRREYQRKRRAEKRAATQGTGA
jgi:HNH endonuclease